MLPYDTHTDKMMQEKQEKRSPEASFDFHISVYHLDVACLQFHLLVIWNLLQILECVFLLQPTIIMKDLHEYIIAQFFVK